MGDAARLLEPDIIDQMKQALGYERLSEKTARTLILIGQGIAIEDANRLVTGETSITRTKKANLKAKSEKWLLNSASMQKLAHKAVKETLQMKPIETEKGPIYPRVSDRLAAASMVTDRTEPRKVENRSHETNLFLGPVQINNYQAQDMVSDSEDDRPLMLESNKINELSDK